jgi:metalloprotease
MLKLGPILIAVAIALAMYHFSAWRLRRELDARSTPLDDPGLRPALGSLARALDVPRIPVHVYEVPAINGLAAPDGRVFLTRGFVERYRSGDVTPEELASVVAHELGHVSLGHSRRRMVDFSGQNAIRIVLAMLLGRFVPFVGVWIANLASSLLAARLSRQDEYEADEYAAALMTKAGLGTAPQVGLFEKLDAMSGRRGTPPAWLMSHPKTADRIAAIRALEARWLARGRR